MAATQDRNRVRVALRQDPFAARQCVEAEGEDLAPAPTFIITPINEDRGRKARRRAAGWYIPA